MDIFGWTQTPAVQSLPSSLNDEALLSALLGDTFEPRCDGGHGGDSVSCSDVYGLRIPSTDNLSLLHCQDAVNLPTEVLLSSGDMVPSIGDSQRDGLLDTLAFSKEPQRAAISNTIFSSYSSTTGGNISSGESNTYSGCGGCQDTEVASPCPTSPPRSKRKLGHHHATTATATASTSSCITFGRQGQQGPLGRGYEPDTEAIAQVKEMIYRAAAMRPVSFGAEATERPQRKNVRISSDPQTVAARLRRERVSERLRALQRLVPGGSKMDTASMLDEAASYLKFLKSQVKALETLGSNSNSGRSQRYVTSTSSSHGAAVLAFGRDGLSGYVRSNRSMQL